MRSLVLLFAAMVLLMAAAMQGKSTRSIERDKAEVAALLVRFWQAYERKDLTGMLEMLTASSEFVFFGSDANEVIKSRRDWQNLMNNDWQLFESTKFAEPTNLSIQVSEDGVLASAVYEVEDVSLVEGRTTRSLDRFAITMRKEDGNWRIVQGMTAVATVGQSSAEIVARRKLKAPKD